MPGKALSQNPLTCSNPFEWFEVHPDGSVFLCCPAWLKASIGNLLSEPVAAIWNSPVAVEIRKTILNGSFHRCSPRRCPRLATRAHPVQPREALGTGEAADAIRQGLSTLGYGPLKLNLCYDHSCNLACPTCRSGYLPTGGAEKARAELLTRRIIAEAAGTAQVITLSGYGDPFASPAYRSLLAQAGPESFPRLREIRLHTNGLLWDEQMWQALPAIHPLVRRAEISVDAATPATYALYRRGGDFFRLLRNL